MFKKIIYSAFLILVFLLGGCRVKNDVNKYHIVIKGSDTMVNLSQSWAEEYMRENENVSVQVTGGGSSNGIASFINGAADIVNTSRELKESELEKASGAGKEPVIIKAALDGVAVIVNSANEVDSITISQLRDIYTGRIKNWKEVGGTDVPVVLYGRESNSGTFEFFKHHVLAGPDGRIINFDRSTQFLQGTSAIGRAVANDFKGVGYGGLGYFVNMENIKILAVKSDENSNAVVPVKHGQVDYDVIWEGKYPLARWLYLIKNEQAGGEVNSFIDFAKSRRGQKIVKDMEFIPVPQ